MLSFKTDKTKQAIALTIIFLLGIFLLIALSGFLSSFLGAVIFYVICAPVAHFFSKKFKLKKGLAVSLTLILSLLVIVIPIFSLTYLLVNKLTVMLSGTYDFYAEIKNLTNYININYGVNILSQENIVKLQTQIANFIPNLLGQTLSVLADIGIMYFILFYLLYTETSLEKGIIGLLPYKKENTDLFTKELVAQTYSNVIGSPLIALIQGAFSTFGFWIFGLNEPVFWGLMCGFLSFIPFVGTALVWVPAGIVLYTNGMHWQGLAVLIYGLVVIVNIDNVFRFILQKKIANVHPLVTVFGVIIGLKWFGLPGIIFGPLLISYFLIMVKIYRTEYENENFILSKSIANNESTGDEIKTN